MLDSLIDVILTFTIALDSTEFTVLFVIMIALCLFSLPFGFYFIRHGRIMQDTPTSRIRSASQGFVELEGKARSIDDKPLRAPGSQKACVWYDYKVEEKRGKDWHTIEKQRSPYSFYIDDGTGVCAIDPDEATVKSRSTRVWVQGKHRFTESRIHEREEIYCLGQFETEQGPSRQKLVKENARVWLNQLKADRKALLRKFDANGDGEIDMDEWNIARQAAKVEAKKAVDDDYEPTQHHVLVKPFNRKNPFIVSSYDERELTLRYRFYSLGLFATFFLAGIYAIVMGVVRWGI